MAGFRFQESGNGAKEVKDSEAHTYGFGGSLGYGGLDGGLGRPDVRGQW